MKIERISENKIKIELSEGEITCWSNIPQGRIPNYNAMMLDLISAVEKETGISFRDCQVVVEASRNSEGSYVIYVTRNARRKPASKPQAHRITDKFFKPKTEPSPRIVAEFEDIEAVMLFDKHYPFYAKMLAGSNSLYSYNNRYYLEISLPAHFESYADSLRGNLSEFSLNAGGSVIPYVLAEHARCLVEKNALLTLRKINR